MKITVNEVTKSYGDIQALRGPSFDIPAGSTFGVLGTNGAGKTTLFRLLVGYEKPDGGHITVGGVETTAMGSRIRERISFLPEQVGYPPLLTGREVLEVHAGVHRSPAAADRIDPTLTRVGLESDGERQIVEYSNGMRRRLGLAAALLSEPSVLVLDEPTAGLDPRGVESFHRIIERIDRETDATVILSSHVLPEVERICDEVAIMHDGRLCAAGSIDSLTADTAEVATLTIRPADRTARHRIIDAVAPFGSQTVNDDHIHVSCNRRRLFECIQSIRPDDVRRIEVSEPGLDTIFHEAIDAVTGEAAT